MKQQLLYAYEHSRFSFGHAEREEQTYMGVQLVKVATHGDTYVVLRHTLAAYKRGLSLVTMCVYSFIGIVLFNGSCRYTDGA